VRSAIAYAPGHGPLHTAGALAASVYLGSLVLVAFVSSNPVVLAGAGCAAAVAGALAGAGRAVALSARWAAALGVLIVAVNAIASQRGDTILVRGFEVPVLGQLDVSAEALAEGGVLALRIGVVFCAFAIHSACVDPDRMLRLLRPLARHSALTATLITRLVPLAAGDHSRLREAAALRGPAAAPIGRAAIARRLLAGSLDRAVDVAATLELRGYARGAPGRPVAARPSRHSWRFVGSGVVIAALAIAAELAGSAGFEAYPTISVDTDASTLALAAALPVLAALPYLGLARRRRGPSGRSDRPREPGRLRRG
jgi:energy-coupling factor transport system permease protein